MVRFISIEQVRLLVVTVLSPVVAFFTPTKEFLLALIIVFAFNLWCGMRADGVAIDRGCKNFKWRKFRYALVELLLFMVIEAVIYAVMGLCGDREAAVLTMKSLTYVFAYVYLQNSFKNLVIAYPKEEVYHVIYRVIRLEFKKAMPGKIKDAVEWYEERQKKEEGKAI